MLCLWMRYSFLNVGNMEYSVALLFWLQMPNCGSPEGPWYLPTMHWVAMDVNFNARYPGTSKALTISANTVRQARIDEFSKKKV